MTAHPNNSGRHPLHVLPWWIAAVGAAAVAISITITTLWLLSIAGRNPSLRIEAIKVGLTVGAGTGGALALLLAIRRQWLSERAQAHSEDVARDNAYDATQRRVTDLYGNAVGQLGHDRAAVRLGGLYSLERLAQNHIEHRQTVVDVMCAYLRMPFRWPINVEEQSSPDGFEADSISIGEGAASRYGGSDLQEFQVRLAAQRILTRHLQRRSVIAGRANQLSEAHWSGMRIDLTGAVLIDFDFSRCCVDNVDFRRAAFHGIASFRWAQISGSAWFHGAQFSGRASFRGTRFGADTWFDQAKFIGFVRFDQAQFSGGAWFSQAQFAESVTFNRARFSQGARFGRAQFNSDARFDRAQFNGGANFDHAVFDRATWNETRFVGDATFNKARLRGTGSLESAQFSGGRPAGLDRS